MKLLIFSLHFCFCDLLLHNKSKKLLNLGLHNKCHKVLFLFSFLPPRHQSQTTLSTSKLKLSFSQVILVKNEFWRENFVKLRRGNAG